MVEHYTAGTESVTAWCNECRRVTQHAVSAGRRGRCTEHEAPRETRKQQLARQRRERDSRQPDLFLSNEKGEHS